MEETYSNHIEDKAAKDADTNSKPVKYENEWMLRSVLTDKEKDSIEVKEIHEQFFEELTSHRFTEERLCWLYRWMGVENKKEAFEFLISIWNYDFFDPFATPKETLEKIFNHVNRGIVNIYNISLSSTQPGMIRVTFYSNLIRGICHRRIEVGPKCPHTYNDGYVSCVPVNYNIFVLEEEILRLLKHHNSAFETRYKSTSYLSKDIVEEKPVPYAQKDD